MARQAVAHAGARRLLQLRQQAGKSQLQVEAEAELGFGYVQRIESGKVRQPLRTTLERLLRALGARYSERREVLGLFGYQSATPLPDAADIAWARAAVQPDLAAAAVPAYLLDCAVRLLAWNALVPTLFPVVGRESERIASEHWSMLRLLFSPRFGIAGRLQNRDTLLLQLLNTLQHELQRIGDEPWIGALLAELDREIPQFQRVWRAAGQLHTASATRPSVPLQIELPAGGMAHFWAAAEPVTRDVRFRLIYLLPIDAPTMAWCTHRAAPNQATC